MTHSEEEWVSNGKSACVRQRSYHEAVPRDEVGLAASKEGAMPELKTTKDGEKMETACHQEKYMTKQRLFSKSTEELSASPSAPDKEDWLRRRGLQSIAKDVLDLSDKPKEVRNGDVEPEKFDQGTSEGGGRLEVGDKGAEDDDDPDMTVDWNADEDDFQRPAKLDLIVGFLRLFSFISVCTSVFAVILSILFPISQTEEIFVNMWQTYTLEGFQGGANESFKVLEPRLHSNPNYPRRDFLFYLRCICGVIQLAFLFVNAAFVTIDSIGTVTFRWKEYGELTHRHTDATSIMFLVSKSRWKQRFLAGLTAASATSLQTANIILNYYGQGPQGAVHSRTPDKSVHAVVWYLSLMFVGLVSVGIGYLLHLIPAKWRNVPWLDNYQTAKHIDDKDDKWKSFYDLALHRTMKRQLELDSISSQVPLKHDQTESPSSCSKPEEKIQAYKKLTSCGYVLETQKRIIYFVSYVISITMNIYVFLLIDLKPHSFEFWTCLLSTVSNTLISFYLVSLVAIEFCQLPPRSTPFLSKIYVPFTLSCGMRTLLDVNMHPTQKTYFGYVYCILLGVYLSFHIIGFCLRRWTIQEPINNFIVKFFRFNFYTSEGAYKKWVRLFDTIGGFCGLIALILGIFSLLCDQYDVEFEVEGELKEFLDEFSQFSGHVKEMVDHVRDLIKSLETVIPDFTCEKIYQMVGGAIAIGGVISFIPGLTKHPRMSLFFGFVSFCITIFFPLRSIDCSVSWDKGDLLHHQIRNRNEKASNHLPKQHQDHLDHGQGDVQACQVQHFKLQQVHHRWLLHDPATTSPLPPACCRWNPRPLLLLLASEDSLLPRKSAEKVHGWSEAALAHCSLPPHPCFGDQQRPSHRATGCFQREPPLLECPHQVQAWLEDGHGGNSLRYGLRPLFLYCLFYSQLKNPQGS